MSYSLDFSSRKRLLQCLNNKLSCSILLNLDGDFFGWLDKILYKFWPLNESDRVRILKYFHSTDRMKRWSIFDTIKVKMIDSRRTVILLIVRICWTSNDEFGIMKMLAEKVTNKCTFSSTEITIKEYPVSRKKRKQIIVEGKFIWNDDFL